MTNAAAAPGAQGMSFIMQVREFNSYLVHTAHENSNFEQKDTAGRIIRIGPMVASTSVTYFIPLMQRKLFFTQPIIAV